MQPCQIKVNAQPLAASLFKSNSRSAERPGTGSGLASGPESEGKSKTRTMAAEGGRSQQERSKNLLAVSWISILHMEHVSN